MVGTGFGIGAPFNQFGQPIQGTSPYGVSPFGVPSTLQTWPYLQSQQHIPSSFGSGWQPPGLQPQAYSQPVQQLLQILPQQLAQLNQLVQYEAQQLHHIQQLLQILPQQIQQMHLHTQQQPFGAQAAQGFGSFNPWQQPGQGFNSPAFTGPGGSVM